jgi:choline-sulfatase
MSKSYLPRYKDWEEVYSGKIPLDGPKEEKDFGRIIKEGYPGYHQFGTDENPFGDAETVEAACNIIENYKNKKPFFMYVGTTGPHDPYIPPQAFIDLYDIKDIILPFNFHDDMRDKPALYRRTKERFDLTEAEHKESIRRYLAFCSYEDYLFGKLLDTVTNRGIMDNTVIMYLSDHGDYMGAHGLWTKGLPCFKEAYHICAAIGGAVIPGGIINDIFVSLADFAPTILQLAGVESSIKHEGNSLIPFLSNEKHIENGRTTMFTQTNGNEVYGIQRAVWNRKWKYIFNTFDYDELYDLENDPGELKNLINDKVYQPVVKEMCKKMWQFAEKTKDNCTCPYIMVSLAPYGPGIIN